MNLMIKNDHVDLKTHIIKTLQSVLAFSVSYSMTACTAIFM